MPNRRRIWKAGPRRIMKAIILSAGQGSRLGHLADDRPKCLIDFNGRTLLDRQLDTLAANGVDEAVVVTGFHDELIEPAIAARAAGPRCGRSTTPSTRSPTISARCSSPGTSSTATAWCGTATLWCRDALMARVVGNDRRGICVTIDRKRRL